MIVRGSKKQQRIRRNNGLLRRSRNIFELVGLFLLHKLCTIIPKDFASLYRDDGLAILRNSSGPNTDRIKKEL